MIILIFLKNIVCICENDKINNSEDYLFLILQDYLFIKILKSNILYLKM
jgi:hypothetical protein